MRARLALVAALEDLQELGGRGRLPVCVVRMRSVLRFMGVDPRSEKKRGFTLGAHYRALADALGQSFVHRFLENVEGDSQECVAGGEDRKRRRDEGMKPGMSAIRSSRSSRR